MLEKQGRLIKGGFDLVLEDVLISSEDIPGWAVATESGLTVALDIWVTEELKREGIARDFVNRVQNLRKEQGLRCLIKLASRLKKMVKRYRCVNRIQRLHQHRNTGLTLELKDTVANGTK